MNRPAGDLCGKSVLDGVSASHRTDLRKQSALIDSLHRSELGSGSSADFYAIGVDNASMTRHMRDCTATAGSGTLAAIRYLQIHIYFVANNDQAGDGIPTLKRVEIGNQGGTLAPLTVPLVEGVENLQMEYGLDTKPRQAKQFYAVIAVSTAVGMLINFTGINPIRA